MSRQKCVCACCEVFQILHRLVKKRKKKKKGERNKTDKNCTELEIFALDTIYAYSVHSNVNILAIAWHKQKQKLIFLVAAEQNI